MATNVQKLPDKLMSSEEIVQKKEELKHITNGDSKENIPPTLNGHSNGTSSKLQNGHSLTPDMDISESENTIIKSPTSTAQKNQNSVDMNITLKRRAIEDLTAELTNEEAKYTVLKKIRIATHQEEESTKKEEVKTEKISTTISNKVKTIASENKFKPINPASSSVSALSSPTVMSPTPSKVKPIKKITNVRDVEDVIQLANYLATNPRLSENDKINAQKVVFRKQMDKYLKSCPPPKPEKPDVIFFPSNNSGEFVNLAGLEQVVHHIKIMNSRKKDAKKNPYASLANAEDWTIKETKPPGTPNCCSKCGIDFSPQWYTNVEDDSLILCTSCVAINRKKFQVKDYGHKLRETFAAAVTRESFATQQMQYDCVPSTSEVANGAG